jgi:hypothetical protein
MKHAKALVIRISFSLDAGEDDSSAAAVSTGGSDTKAPPPEGSTRASTPRPFHGRDTRPTEASPSDDRGMSDAQKKALFRLALALGDKDGALARVLEALGVKRLEEATRAGASRAIDALKAKVTRGTSGPSNGASHG